MTNYNDRIAALERNPFAKDALPLLREMAKALSEAQADARVFSNSYNALAEDFGRLKEECKALRETDQSNKLIINRYAEDLAMAKDGSQYSDALYKELKAENDRLRKGIGRAQLMSMGFSLLT